MSDLAARPQHPAVGIPVPHESAALHATGRALYTDDLTLRASHPLHAWPVQTCCAHGRVTALDVAPALAIPGVVRVLTAADVPGVNDGGENGDEPLFPTEIMFYGQAVCWVLAEDIEAARLGAAAVRVQVAPLPAYVTVQEAIAASSFQGEWKLIARGDVETALEQAEHVFSGELEIPGQEHFYLETQAALAYVDEAGQVFVHSSTQNPSGTQAVIAHLLALRSSEVTVQSLRMGGGFGGKEVQANGIAAIAALGTVLSGRPVRVRLNRTQDLTMTGKRHNFRAAWRAGFDSSGHLQALETTLTADGGWCLDLSQAVLARAMCHVDNAYFVANIRIRGRIAKTNRQSNTAFRGFGGPQGMLVIEDILGRCAPLLGFDPLELRSRNFYQSGQTTPFGQPVRQVERLAAVWEQTLANADVRTRLEQIKRFNETHAHVKRGLAVTPVKFGISFNQTYWNQAGALVLVYKDGSVLVNHGGTDMGQGLHTKILQVAATAFGIPLERVRLAPTRTDKVPNTSATSASTGSDLNGAAVKDACEQIRDRLLAVASELLGAAVSTLRIVDGVAFAADAPAAKRLAWDELVHAAYMRRVQLSAAGFYRTEGLEWDEASMHGHPFKYFAYGAAAAEVEVDGFTGAYRTLRVDIVHDVGDSLSPLVDLGQIEGGFVQGAGWLTLEDLRWDTSDGDGRGRLLTQAASTYKLPSFAEMPETFNVTMLRDAAEPGAVYGAKAVGEPPLMLAFSVREALRQAVAAFAPGQQSVQLACPSTPEAVFWAIERARGRAGGGSVDELSAPAGRARPAGKAATAVEREFVHA